MSTQASATDKALAGESEAEREALPMTAKPTASPGGWRVVDLLAVSAAR